MEEYKIELIKSAIVLAAMVISRQVTSVLLRTFSKRLTFDQKRFLQVKKVKNILISSLAVIIILTIWSVGKEDVLLFLTTTITVIGVGLFAQWSLLSNITASVILYLNYPAKIGDKICVLDKEFSIEGLITDIGVFFILVKTDKGELITLPNSVILQKMINIFPGDTKEVSPTNSVEAPSK